MSKYICISENIYRFEVGKIYQVEDMDAEFPDPNSESLEMVEVVIFEGLYWIPKSELNKVLKEVEIHRTERIDSILN